MGLRRLKQVLTAAAAAGALYIGSPDVGAHEEITRLTPRDQATNTAIRSGNWSAPETWDPEPPKPGARILIGQGIIVTVDQEFADRYEWIRIDGVLRFDPGGFTELVVETLAVEHTGRLEIGTAAEPVTGRAVLTFHHRGEPINHDYDPGELSRGLVAIGHVEMAGSSKTSWVTLSRSPEAGASWLDLDSEPFGWSPDDTIVLTAPEYGRDETFRILTIDGAHITLDHPIANARPLPVNRNTSEPYEGLSLHVANLTRNVVVRTHPDYAGRPAMQGHVMMMHDGGHQIRNVEFADLGRTTVAPVSDPLIVNGVRDPSLAPMCGLETENVRGRYSVHFHMAGPESPQSLVEGTVVKVARDAGFKIGYINHSSNVSFRNNVGYQIDGSTFFTEEGDETGEFVGNIAIHSKGSNNPNDGQPRDVCTKTNYPELHHRRRHDVGHRGHGYWIHGGGVDVIGNVASGHGSSGFEFWSRPLNFRIDNTYEVRFPVSKLRDGGGWAGNYTSLDVNFVPGLWRENVSYVTSAGRNSRKAALSIHYHGQHQADRYPGAPKNLIDGFLGWNTVNGVMTSYSGWIAYLNTRLINGDAADGSGMRLGTQGGNNNVLRRVSVDGFQIGIAPSSMTIYESVMVDGEPYLPPPLCGGAPCEGETQDDGHEPDSDPPPSPSGGGTRRDDGGRRR